MMEDQDKKNKGVEKEKSRSYTAESIQVLKGLEGVRKRPAMYIGSTGKEGLHHLVFEVVDNSIDEALAGYCNTIIVIIHKDGTVSVEDNGRGIPVEKHKETGKSALETVMTMLHAGGKFDKKVYMISGGLHGVGVSVVNALSEWLTVRIKRDGVIYEQKYKRGEPITKLQTVGKTTTTGTTIIFKPDSLIFSTTNFNFGTIETKLRELSFLNPGVKITLIDERINKKLVFLSKEGLKEFIEWVNKNRTPLHKPVHFKDRKNDTIVEVSLQYHTGYIEDILSFVNTISTIEGGTHVSGFKKGLTRVINDYGTRNKILKFKLTGDDIREGLTAIIGLKIPEPQFEGQTKTKLGNSEVAGIVESIVTEKLGQFLEENPSTAKKIITKALETAMARQAAKKAKELVRRKSALMSSSLPGKLADCSSRKKEETELFIVEGESAGGSAKQARNKEIQAILPLKGKILNVEKANPNKVFSNQEISSLITSIGTAVTDKFNIDKLRYSKIIIMTDADVDGQHIKTLLLTFFFRYMKQLIEYGHVYLAVPPLYKIRKGQTDKYVYNDNEMKKIVAQHKNVVVQRFKGLGEMNPEQLWQTTMNPKTRKLKKVLMEDAVEADKLFTILMGEKVEPRKQFIVEHAKEAELDV